MDTEHIYLSLHLEGVICRARGMIRHIGWPVPLRPYRGLCHSAKVF